MSHIPPDWDNPYSWPRIPLLSANAVATSQPLAAQSGLRALLQGGNAVDAAVAAAITLAVVEPASNGIGSDAHALIWDGRALHGLNGSGRAPGAWTPEAFPGGMPVRGWNSVTVPGCVSAWRSLSQRFGRLPFERLFDSAIDYARRGFLVSPKVAEYWAQQTAELCTQPGFAHAFLRNGRAPAPGELFSFPAQADALEEIAVSRGDSFYLGSQAARLVAHGQAHGGLLSEADLASHRSDWVAPLAMEYRGYSLHELPPSTQGIVALIALGILAQQDVRSHPVDSAGSLHLQIEALKLAFADAWSRVGDTDRMPAEAAELLDPEYLRARSRMIDHRRAQVFGPTGPQRGGTVALTTADANGMMVSYIQSNCHGFGSGIVVDGISLHNRGCDFTTRRDHPNCVGPSKRPYHTLMPGFVTKAGQPVLAMSFMGGSMQPQSHVQILVRIADYGQSPQAACDAPRFRVADGLTVQVEHGLTPQALDGLRSRGHNITEIPRHGDLFGWGQIVWKLSDGYLTAGDPRCDGQAVGF
ncbi:MAG: gamma-glutamyltransferase family protein [Polyangia bacterium]